jgi:MoxR-like ATPase
MALARPVLSHRMALSFSARARGLSLGGVIDRVSEAVTRIEAAA